MLPESVKPSVHSRHLVVKFALTVTLVDKPLSKVVKMA